MASGDFKVEMKVGNADVELRYDQAQGAMEVTSVPGGVPIHPPFIEALGRVLGYMKKYGVTKLEVSTLP